MTRIRLRAALAALIAPVLLVSCTTVSGLASTTEALRNAGYRSPNVEFTPTEAQTVLKVSYRTGASDVSELGQEYAEVARLVWQKAPISFDEVDISASGAPGPCAGDCQRVFTRAALTALYGPRPPGLDKDTRRELIGAGLAVIVAVLGLLTLTIWLIVRARRKARVSPWAYGAPAPGSATGPDWRPPPVAATPHPPAPGYAPPPPGYVAPQAAAGPPPAWPPASAPPAYEPPEPPMPTPTHDIWQRPPS